MFIVPSLWFIVQNAMKILHVTTHFYPFIGGLENMVFDLVKAQSKKHEVSILTCRYDKNLPIFEEIEGVRIYRVPSFEILKNQYSWPKFGFSKKIREINSDVIFTHTRFFATSFFGQKFKSKKVKKIHVEHGQNFVRSKNIFIKSFARIFDQTLGKFILKSADSIIVLGEEGRNFVIKLGGKNLVSRINIIPNGVKIPEKFKKNPRKNRAMFFGRIIPEKGVEEILSAAKKCPNWQFSFYGGSMGSLGSNVKFYGEVLPEQISEKIQESDLVILPSWSEGNSLAILEAAANARAILATPVGQNEVIVSSELLVPIRSEEKIVEKLNFLENNWETLERVGVENLERVKKHYCFEEMVAAYEALL